MADNIPAIESLEDYIRRYGLPNADAALPHGEFNGLNREEAAERIRTEAAYLDAVIERHHSSSNSSDGAGLTPRLEEEVEDSIILVLLADESTHTVSASSLLLCDTVKRMISSRSRFGVKCQESDECSESKENEDIFTNECKDQEYEHCNNTMELSLVEFEPDAVLQFLDSLVILTDQQKEALEIKNAQINNDETPSKRQKNDRIIQLIENDSISEKNIVECLKIAHYLQCRIILDGLTSILEASIDSKNCMAICSLADALNLQSLFEASVNHVIERLDAMDGQQNYNSDGEEKDRSSSSEEEGEEEIWQLLPHELKSRLLTMRNVMRSSIIGRGSKVSGVFFSSANEFLAIFKETIRDQKERLRDAKERREEVIRERTEEWIVRKQRRGRWFDTSAEAERQFIYGGDVAYALKRLEIQERRLRTLQSFYSEQKVIFSCNGELAGNKELVL